MGSKMQFNVEWFDSLNSTNAFLRKKLASTNEGLDGCVISTYEQTKGRGRGTRSWVSSPRTNLCFSFFIKTDVKLVDVPSSTMAVALAVTEWLKEQGVNANPKWPNDVLVNGKKICGILSEHVDQGIVVGVGLNINMNRDEAEKIDRPATSLFIETGEMLPLPEALESLLLKMGVWVERWKEGGFKAIQEIWIQQAGPLGKPLCVHDGETIKTGKLAGFGSFGELHLQTDQGLEIIWSGEIPLEKKS